MAGGCVPRCQAAPNTGIYALTLSIQLTLGLICFMLAANTTNPIVDLKGLDAIPDKSIQMYHNYEKTQNTSEVINFMKGQIDKLYTPENPQSNQETETKQTLTVKPNDIISDITQDNPLVQKAESPDALLEAILPDSAVENIHNVMNMDAARRIFAAKPSKFTFMKKDGTVISIDDQSSRRWYFWMGILNIIASIACTAVAILATFIIPFIGCILIPASICNTIIVFITLVISCQFISLESRHSHEQYVATQTLAQTLPKTGDASDGIAAKVMELTYQLTSTLYKSKIPTSMIGSENEVYMILDDYVDSKDTLGFAIENWGYIFVALILSSMLLPALGKIRSAKDEPSIYSNIYIPVIMLLAPISTVMISVGINIGSFLTVGIILSVLVVVMGIIMNWSTGFCSKIFSPILAAVFLVTAVGAVIVAVFLSLSYLEGITEVENALQMAGKYSIDVLIRRAMSWSYIPDSSTAMERNAATHNGDALLYIVYSMGPIIIYSMWGFISALVQIFHCSKTESQPYQANQQNP